MAILNASYAVEAIWPASAAEASEETRSAVDDGATVVVAMGGDGIVHHVAQGVVDTPAVMGVIPVGTTNVTARLFDIPSNPSKAAKIIVSKPTTHELGTVKMDLTRGTAESTHYALFACGLGLDADVVIEADKEPYKKYRFGSLHYATTTLGVALRSFPKKRPHVTVTRGNQSTEVAAALFQFRSVYTFFGRLPITLDREDPDPITALLMKRLRRRRVPAIAVKVFLRRDLDELKDVEIWTNVESVSASARPPVAAQADGESLGVIDQAEISWHPNSLRMLGPHLSP